MILRRFVLAVAVALFTVAVTGWADSVVERVSLSTKGLSPNSPSGQPAISGDGRYVVFSSDDESLDPPDREGFFDVFVRDRVTGQTDRVSIGSFKDGLSGEEPNSESDQPSISTDGRYVVFRSFATNIATNTPNDSGQIFVFDRTTRKTTLVSARPDGKPCQGFCRLPSISGDGRVVAFRSSAGNLVANDENAAEDIFVRDLTTRKTTRASVKTGGIESSEFVMANSPPRLSFDGRFVVFASGAEDLVDNDDNGSLADVFLHDRQAVTTTLVSLVSNPQALNRKAFQPDISADGRFVAFADFTSAFSDGDESTLDGNGSLRLFDRITGQTVSLGAGSGPRLSADGGKVAFVQNSAGNNSEVKVLDRSNGSVIFASPRQVASNNFQNQPSLSADGRVVAFKTFQALSVDDDNSLDDVYATPLFDTIAVESAVVQANENGGSVQVRLRRFGQSLGEISVTRSVSAPGDTAAPGVDYDFPGGLAVGTVTWPAGDTGVRTVTVPLINRPATLDGYRVFTVTLSAPTGGAELGPARTLVLIRDPASVIVEDQVGHGLKIIKAVDRGTAWGARLFRGEFTLRNPSAVPSFAGRLGFLFQPVDPISRQPNGAPVVVASLNHVPAIPAGGEIQLIATVDMTPQYNGSQLDGFLYAQLFEITTMAGEVLQDTALATVFDTADGVTPPAGGATQPNAGVDAPGFSPIRIASVTVAGVAQLNENSTSTFTAMVKLTNGNTLANVTPQWKTSRFAINGGGLLSAGEVSADTKITVSATVTREGQTVTGSKSVTMKNVPAVPVITSALTAFASLDKAFSYKIAAIHEPTSFEATGLPDGLSVNTSTGVISGTPITEGAFNVQIKAENTLGADTEMLVLTVSAPSPLTVELDGTGSGTVSGIGKTGDPFPRIEVRETGRTYTLTAKPDAVSLFESWLDGNTATTPKLTFVMKPSLKLVARFVPNIFLDKAGKYYGLITDTPVAHDSTGSVLITLGKTGTFTGKLVLGGKSLSIKGTLRPDGSLAAQTIARAGLPPVTCTLLFDPNTATFTGTLTDGVFEAAIDAVRAVTTAGALEGRYTVLMPTGPDAPDLPQGVGYGAVTVSAKGAIKLAGSLGDGTTVSAGSTLTEGGLWALYLPLYGGGGSLAGPVVFSVQATTDLEGAVFWFKPVASSAAFYPTGWPNGLAVDFHGSRYLEPPASAVFPGLNPPGGNGNSVFTAHGGALLSDQVQILDVDDSGGVALLPPLLEKFSLSFAAKTGLYKGRVYDVITRTTRSFNGAVLQKSGEAAGNFKGGEKRTGSVNIEPAP